MERFLNTLFRYVPEWVVVLAILAGGLYYFMIESPLYGVCDAQSKEFLKGQKGKLFPEGVRVLNPKTGSIYSESRLAESRKKCKNSIRGMGCREYFNIFASTLEDFDKFDDKCLLKVGKQTYIQEALGQYLATLTELAWGASPPQTQVQKRAWLSDKNLQSFCSVREYYRRFYPSSAWENLVSSTLKDLTKDPKEAQLSRVQKELAKRDQAKEEKEEEDVYFFPKAKMTIKKAYELSLFSFDCMYYK